MADIINLNDHKPHLSGEIKCIGCGHKWIGVSPITEYNYVEFLECPKCRMMKGLYIHPVLPTVGESFFRCNCGGDVFSIVKGKGVLCARCGNTTTFEELY